MKRMVLLGAAVSLVVVACTSASDSSTTSVPETLTTTSTVSTTEIPTTSAPEATTTTEVETTTTAVPETTTTTEVETTTTAAASSVELSDEGVLAEATWVPFGTTDEDAIEATAAVLGAPSLDTGWIDSFSKYGTCPGSVVRGVEWGAFVMLFTQSDTDFWTGGVPHFFSYYLTDVFPDLATTKGIRIGSTLTELEDVYGGPSFVIDEAWFDPTLGFWSYDLQRWTGSSGFATGQSSEDTVTSIDGGQGCGE